VITPVVGHTTCDLDQQRRLIEARRAGAARRALAPRSGRHLRRLLPNRLDAPGRGHAHLDLGSRGEDVWRALRY
jgi:hypothetical protein